MRPTAAAWIAGALVACAPARPPARPPDAALEAAAPSAVAIPGGPYALRGDLFTPAGRGPFPAIVYNHGSERDPSLDFLGTTGRWFQQHGFVVLFVYRRGAGGSDGPYWQDTVERLPTAAQAQATVDALEAETEDVMIAGRWLASRPEVDPERLAVAGCSFGGIVSLLAAERGEPFRASVDFAGASITWAGNAPLRARLTAAAQAARIPIFLLQAANDFDTSPTRLLSAAMTAAGRPHTQRIFPPHGVSPMEGHAHFCNYGQAEWGPEVLAFLLGR